MALPPGFVIDELPSGFAIDEPTTQEQEFKELGFFEQLSRLFPSPTEQAKIAREKIFEPAAAIATGGAGELVAGATGVGALLRGAGPEVAEQEIEEMRKGLTFQPPTEEGREALQAVGEVLEPVGEKLQEVRKSTGDLAMRLTDSPAVAAIATALPDAALEALGFGVGRRFAQVKTGVKRAPEKIPSPGKVKERTVTKSLLESAPQVSQIKDASRAIYKEIDDLNVTTKPIATQSLVNKVVKRARKENVDRVLTPDSARVVELFTRELDDVRPRTISDFDRLRQQAQQAAQAAKPADARIGAIMVDEIDSFLDNLPKESLIGPDAKTAANVSQRYKTARNLWGRARRAELISEAFDKAERGASGFENGLRNQFRQILNNNKRARFFTKGELKSMDDVVKGADKANILKLVGRLGLSEGGATNILGGLGGMAVLGPAAVPIGQISRKFAQKATKAAAQNVEALIRGGASGREITRAYLKAIPAGKRSVQELSDMLLASGAEIDDLLKSADKITKEAAEITRARKIFEQAEAIGTITPAIATQEQQ